MENVNSWSSFICSDARVLRCAPDSSEHVSGSEVFGVI